MAYYFSEPSRTFGEYLLVPGYSSSECVPTAVSLKTPLVKYRKGEETCPLEMNIPMVSAIMQSVSGEKLAIALAKQGGVSFIYGSQTIEQEADMVRRVKAYKKGFVTSDSNLPPEATLGDVLDLKTRTGHSTVAITHDGTAHGKLLGIVASRDYRLSRMTMDLKVTEFMTPLDKLITAPDTTSLHDCNDIIWDNKINSLPLIDAEGHLQYMVFRKDYDSHKENINELLDENKSYVVGAGINTRDFAQRVPALVDAGVDVLCIDSSEGFSEWQSRTIAWIRENYGDKVMLLTARASSSLPRQAQTSSRSASAAAPSASPVRPRASAAVRLRLSSRLPRPAMSIIRRPASTSPSALTAASCRTTTSRWHWPWALTSSCWAAISPALMSPRRTSCASAATMSRSTGARAPTAPATGSGMTSAAHRS